MGMAGTTWGSSPYAEGAENKVEEASLECDLKFKQPNANGSCLSFPPPGGCRPLVPAPSLQAGSGCKASLGFCCRVLAVTAPQRFLLPLSGCLGSGEDFMLAAANRWGRVAIISPLLLQREEILHTKCH